MILHSLARSVRSKLLLVILATTFTALFIAAVGMVVFDVKTYQKSWVEDLVTQAKIIARASGPSLAFNDPTAARDNLNLLKERPQILAAAIYTNAGKPFATYSQNELDTPVFRMTPGIQQYQIDGNQLVVRHLIIENNETVGVVYLRARYALIERIANYSAILATVLAGSLIVAALIAVRLQATITAPIIAVTNVAREVIQKRDFSLRVQKTTNDEIGVLVDAFNGMLNEVARRADALEELNRSLAQEMAVRRNAESELLAADKRKDEFLATLAHELRNPLAPISTGLEILRMMGHDTEASQRAREIMARQLKQMVRLIDDLLDVSRITTGKLAIKMTRCELQAVAHNAVETVAPFVASHGHTLRIDFPDKPVFLNADAMRLAQVFSNLLNNAAKYTATGGEISFSGTVKDGSIVIRVADSGIGISDDMLTKIFEMFTQVDYSLERTQAGLGVGLTLAKRLIELHGGAIEARSEGLHRGSEFFIRLPLASESPVTEDRPMETIAAPAEEMHRILLADDNIDFVTTMAAMISQLGHEVHVTHNGMDALAAAAWFRPAFAFLDIGMPLMNGYELAQRLRANPDYAGMMLIAVTGWGQDKDRERAYDAGFHHHMVKPITLAQVQSILRQSKSV